MGAGFLMVMQNGIALCEDELKTNPGACTPGSNLRSGELSVLALPDKLGAASYQALLSLA